MNDDDIEQQVMDMSDLALRMQSELREVIKNQEQLKEEVKQVKKQLNKIKNDFMLYD